MIMGRQVECNEGGRERMTEVSKEGSKAKKEGSKAREEGKKEGRRQ